MKNSLFVLTLSLSMTPLLLSGCVTSSAQQKNSLLEQFNQLSLKVHSLEQQNQELERKNLENDQVIAQIEDDLADLKVKQEAQTKLVLNQLAKAKPAANTVKLTNKNIQKALQTAGYDIGPIDGKIGVKTREAITAFQQTNDLNPDGIVGGTTWEKLQTHLTKAEE